MPMTVLKEHRLLVLAMCSALFFMPFMLAGVHAVLPPLGETLNASARELSLIGAVYSLGLVLFQMAGGTLGDIFGSRRVFLAGISVFGGTTVLLGFVNDINLFIFLRLIQASGCATFSASSLALLASAAPPKLRANYLGFSGIAVYSGMAFGPPAGGFIAGCLGWRWLFWITGTLALCAMLLTIFGVKMERRPAQGQRFDTRGFLIYTVAMTALTIGASELADYPWLGGGALLLWIVLTIGLCFYERNVAFPLLDVHMLSHSRVMRLSLIAAFVNYCALFGMVFFFSLYLQVGRGMSAEQTGLLLSLQAVVQALSNPFAASLCMRWNEGHVSTLGCVLCGVGLILLAFLDMDPTLTIIVLSQVLLGVGVSFFVLPNTSIIIGCAGENNVGRASGLVGSMRTAGILCNMVIITLTMTFFLGHEPVTTGNMDRFIVAMRTDLILFGVLNLLAVGCTMVRSRVS